MKVAIYLFLRILYLEENFLILDKITGNKLMLHNIGNLLGVILNLNIEQIDWANLDFVSLIAHSIGHIDSNI